VREGLIQCALDPRHAECLGSAILHSRQ
jgi:hypothetical protein